MIRSINKLGDRLLDRLVPTAQAAADPCWYETRASGYYHCCVYAGRTYCRCLYGISC